MRAIAREVQRGTIPPPPLVVTDVDTRPVYTNDFEVAGDTILGELAVAYSPLQNGAIGSRLLRKFAAHTPPPKIIRHESVGAFEAFKADRLASRAADFEKRLAAVEAELAEHVADNHGGGRVARLEDALTAHLDASILGHGGGGGGGHGAHSHELLSPMIWNPVELPIPVEWQPATECWQDGDEVVCAVRTLAPDGSLRVTSTGASFPRALDYVAGCVERLNAHPLAVAPVLPKLAQVVAGMCCLGQLAEAAPTLSRYNVGSGIALRVRSDGDPETRAAMALYQLCQLGDTDACAEWARLCESGSSALCEQARAGVLAAQTRKAKGRQ